MSRTSLHYAVCTSLATWIRTRLADVQGLVVSDRWPDPGPPLPPLAITILPSGEPDYTYIDARVVRFTPPTPPETLSDVVICNAQVEAALQIDLWATNHVQLQNLIDRLEDALHASKADSLGVTTIQPLLEEELALRLQPPWDDVYVGYRFGTSNLEEGGATIQRKEWRATCSGVAFYDAVYFRKAPALSQIVLQATVSNTEDTSLAAANASPPPTPTITVNVKAAK